MAWCWRSAKPMKPLTVPMLTYCQQDPYNQTSMKFDRKYKHFYSKQILENVVGKMGAILFRQYCVKKTMGRFYHWLCQCWPVCSRFGTTWHLSTAYLHLIHTMSHIVILGNGSLVEQVWLDLKWSLGWIWNSGVGVGIGVEISRVGIGVGVETSGVGVGVGVDILEICRSWSWSWSWNLWSWSWSWYYEVDPNPDWCGLIDNYFRHKTPYGIRKLTAALVSKIGVFSCFFWSLDFGPKMAEFPLPVLQIWRSENQ